MWKRNLFTCLLLAAVAMLDYSRFGWWEQDPLPGPLAHCRYDKERADEAMEAARLFRVVDGPCQGQPFDPAAVRWQEQVIRPLYGIVRKADGLRQYTRVYILVPKKSGKSPFAAFLGIYSLLFDYWVDPATGWKRFENGSRTFLCATSVQQALNVFDPCRGFLQENPDTRGLINNNPTRIRPGQIKISASENAHSIRYWPESAPIENKIEIVSSTPDRHEGKGINTLVLDELHLMRRSLRQIFEGSQDAKIQPVEVMISTAGEKEESPDNIWLEEHKIAVGSLREPASNPRLLPVIYAPAEEDEDSILERDIDECMEIAKRVNPGIGVTILEDRFRLDMAKASVSRWAWANFCRRRLNWITEGLVETFIPLAQWDQCSGDWDSYREFEDSLKGRACYIGLDLSSKTDLTSMGLVFAPNREGRVPVLSYSWLPAADLEEKAKKDGADYQAWIEQGWLEHNPALHEVDYEAVEKRLAWACKRYKVKGIGGDGWGAATQIAQKAKRRFGVLTESVPTTYTAMSEPMKTLEAMTLGRRIEHGGNPVLRCAMGKLVAKVGLNEEVRPVKAKAKGRVDPAVAVIAGINRLLFSPHRPKVQLYSSAG